MQQTVAIISLKTIVRNALLVKRRAGVPLIAVVKDDAYGHGAERVAAELAPFVAGFAVATVFEGAALRAAGIGSPITVLTPCLSAEEAVRCGAYGLIPSVPSFAAMRLLKGPMHIQLVLNTGMNRYGFRPSLVRSACRETAARGLAVDGVFSHLYAPEDPSALRAQTECFIRGAETVRGFFPQAVRHLAATGGALTGACPFDAVRSGIALYGYLPAGFAGSLPVRPAMKLYATVSGSSRFTGGGVGYGHADKAYSGLHTLRLGYGDGFFRTGGPGIGNLCMDACIGEGALPFGRRKLVLKDVTDYARSHGTTEYEVLVRLGSKAVKIYV